MKDEKQMIWNIKKFEDIIFEQREGFRQYQAELFDDNGRLLSIVYGELALFGANHGMRRSCGSSGMPIEEDMGYEIMDNIGDDINMEYNCGDNCYVVSKEKLMDKIKDAAKYKYCWEEYQDDEFHKGTRICKVKRKGTK